MGTVFGVQFCHFFGTDIRFSRLVAASKVLAYLQMAKVARCTGNKKPLLVNMDETRMLVNYGKQKGLRVLRRSLPPGLKHKKEQLSSAEEKAGLTYIAFITHDTSVQPRLPQILLGNEHVMTLKLLRDLRQTTPGNFRLWRRNQVGITTRSCVKFFICYTSV